MSNLGNLKDIVEGTIRYLRGMAIEEGNPNISADNMIADDLESIFKLVTNNLEIQKQNLMQKF